MYDPEPGVYIPGKIEKAAVRALLELVLHGARAEGARFTARTEAAWEELARSARGPGFVRISPVGPVGADGWISTQEAAVIMGVSDRHVARLCRRGLIRCRRHGERMWLVDRAAALDWRTAA